jgi:hypothetical protein
MALGSSRNDALLTGHPSGKGVVRACVKAGERWEFRPIGHAPSIRIDRTVGRNHTQRAYILSFSCGCMRWICSSEKRSQRPFLGYTMRRTVA